MEKKIKEAVEGVLRYPDEKEYEIGDDPGEAETDQITPLDRLSDKPCLDIVSRPYDSDHQHDR